jgi:hypothetical protein
LLSPDLNYIRLTLSLVMKLTLISALLAVAALPASAVTINLYSGIFRDSLGAALPDGTLFALVADTNANNNFGGGTTLNSTLTQSQANSVFSIGQTLSVGSVLGGDTVFFLGALTGVSTDGTPGLLNTVVNFNLDASTQGLNYAIYFFPGGTLTGGVGTIAGQAGGISSTVAEASQGGLTIPGSNAANVNQGALDVTNGGSLANSRFTAVNLIPEPSTMLLGAFGALGLLRRRR